MAKKNYLHVITRANNRDSIEQHLPEYAKARITFHYYDSPDFIKRIKNKAKGLYPYYFCWQVGIIPIAYRILKCEHIDYSMHLTFGSMWMPTFLPLLTSSFIWGPVGGGDCEPKSFLKVLPWKQRLLQTMRYVLNTLSWLNPFIMIPAARASVILCRTPNSAMVIPSCFQHKVKVVLETAMESIIFEFKKKNKVRGHMIRMITTGRLLPNKNILTAVRSLRYIRNDKSVEFIVVGSGFQKKEIEDTAREIGGRTVVNIVDEMPRLEVLKLLEKCDIFLFPSLREGGSWSLMEAMAIGLPVVCLDWAGMSVTVDDSCAIRIPVTNPTQMPIDMAKAIQTLIDDPDLRRRMGEAGRERIRKVFNWEAKGEFMENLLKELDSSAS
jgi:glycosyltransferase involved in cell wall biosynthesis